MKDRPRIPSGRRNAAGAAAQIHYKVVELSTVDEASMERALNEWASQGWGLDGIHFAMRDSSKRPAMAFLLFTRLGAGDLVERERARQRLEQLAGVGVLATERDE